MDACLCKEHVGMNRSKKKEKKYLNLSTSEERGELLAKTRDCWRKVDKNRRLDECCRTGLISEFERHHLHSICIAPAAVIVPTMNLYGSFMTFFVENKE